MVYPVCCWVGGIWVCLVYLLIRVSGAGRNCLGRDSCVAVRGLPTSDPSSSVLMGLGDGGTLPHSGSRRVVTVGWERSTVSVVVVIFFFWSCVICIHGRAAGTPDEKRAYHFATPVSGFRVWVSGLEAARFWGLRKCTLSFPVPLAGSRFGLLVAGLCFLWLPVPSRAYGRMCGKGCTFQEGRGRI